VAKSELGIPHRHDLNKLFDSHSEFEYDSFDEWNQLEFKSRKRQKQIDAPEGNDAKKGFEAIQRHPNSYAYHQHPKKRSPFRDIQKLLDLTPLPNRALPLKDRFGAAVALQDYLAEKEDAFWSFLTDESQQLDQIYRNEEDAS